MSQKARLGFLGMGLMGQRMARRLVDAGYPLTIWNRSLDKCDELKALGASVGASPKEVVAECSVTFAMLSTPDASMAVLEGENGVASGISSGKGYVEMSTLTPEAMQSIGQRIRAAGGKFLEAPVSGSTKPAADGTLVFMTSGDQELSELTNPMIDIMGKKTVYFGEDLGAATRAKLVVNMTMGSMMAAYTEALSLSEGLGLSQESMIEILGAGAMANPMFAGKGPNMIKQSYEPGFPLEHAQKDIRFALCEGDRVGQAMPVAAAANEAYKKAKGAGLGRKDFSAVHEVTRPKKE